MRIGIIGCGNIARNHVDAFRAAPGVTVVACADRDPDRAAAFAAAHGLPAAYGSVSELLAAGVDAISVCTPHPTHAEVVLEAAAAGVHVLCEKPIAIDLAEAEAMVAACDAVGVRFGVVFQRRWWSAAQQLRAAFDGALGAPVLARASVRLHRDASYYTATPWRGTWATDGGGVLMTQAIHYLDLLEWLCGPAVRVQANAATFKHGDHIEVEDTLVANFEFASGALGQLVATTAATPGLGADLEITGASGATMGFREFPEGAEARIHLDTTTGISLPCYDPSQPDLELSEINGALIPFHVLQVADFVAALRADRDPAVTGRSALGTLRTLLACYESARTGEAVHLPMHRQAQLEEIRS